MARFAFPAAPFPEPSFEPDDPVFRVLNRVKGEGRRRLMLGLVMAGTPLESLPAILVRENLTACEHAAFETAHALELDGELLPDLLPGETEAARVTWSLPDDRRVISLRARPHEGRPEWRLVDDGGRSYSLPLKHTPWPPSYLHVARLLDEAGSSSLPEKAGLFRSAWKRAKKLGWAGDKARRAVDASGIFLGGVNHRRLLDFVDMEFKEFNGEPLFDEEGEDAGLEEEVQ
jgi:hypothetical protein